LVRSHVEFAADLRERRAVGSSLRDQLHRVGFELRGEGAAITPSCCFRPLV
jgi:hypothetical protein